MPLFVFIASIFLVTGRNFGYFTIKVSGAGTASAYNKSKLFVQSLLTVLAWSIVFAITKSSYPVVDVHSSDAAYLSDHADVIKNPWLLITKKGVFHL